MTALMTKNLPSQTLPRQAPLCRAPLHQAGRLRGPARTVALTVMLGGALLVGWGLWSPLAVALPEDASQPIHIEASRAEIDQNAERVTYRGSVQVDQGTMRVTADEMTVEYRDQKVVSITAHGSPATYQQQLDGSRGQVKADARTIVYYTQDERIDLQGEAFLSRGGDEIAGEHIRYDIVEGKVEAESGEQPVRMTLQPPDRAE